MRKKDRLFPNIVDKDTRAREWGFAHAQGDWVVFMQSWQNSSALLKALQALALEDKGVVQKPFLQDINKKHKPVVIANAAECFIGHWKDSVITELEPHKVLEGIALVCVALGVDQGCVVVHADSLKSYDALVCARDAAYAQHVIGPGSDSGIKIAVRFSNGLLSGAEDTAILNHLEGEQGVPKHESCVFGRDVFIANVETFASLGGIFARGLSWWQERGLPHARGTKVFSVAGRVQSPCVFEEEYGTPLLSVIANYAGGVEHSWSDVQCVFPGGVFSKPVEPQFLQNVILDRVGLSKIGTHFAVGSIIVLERKDSVLDFVKQVLRSYVQESCGACTPCREGLAQFLEVNVQVLRKNERTFNKQLRFISDMARCPYASFASDIACALVNKKWKEIV